MTIVDLLSLLPPPGGGGKGGIYLADDIFPILMSISAVLIQDRRLLLFGSSLKVSFLQCLKVLVP